MLLRTKDDCATSEFSGACLWPAPKFVRKSPYYWVVLFKAGCPPTNNQYLVTWKNNENLIPYFFLCNSIPALYMLWTYLSVHLSQADVLVFWYNSTGVTISHHSSGMPNSCGVEKICNFQQIACYVAETMQNVYLVSTELPFPITLSELQGHSLTASPFKCDSSYSYAVVGQISTDKLSPGPSMTAKHLITLYQEYM